MLYRSLLPAGSDWAAKRVTLPGFQTQVGPLKRGCKYEFKVRPYGSDLYGRESNTRHLRVPETGEKRLNSRVAVSFLLPFITRVQHVTFIILHSSQCRSAGCVHHREPRREQQHPPELGASPS